METSEPSKVLGNMSTSKIDQLAEALDLIFNDLLLAKPPRKPYTRHGPHKPHKNRMSGIGPEQATTLGEFVTARRLELKLTQKEFAQQGGISRPKLSKIERDRYHPGRKMLAKISTVLKCEIPEVLLPTPGRLGRPKKLQ
jgi:DNA-binding XRE family transcriptional regulator